MEEHFVLSHSMIRILFNKQRRGNRDHGKTVCGTWFNYLLTGPLRTNRHSFRLKPPFLRSILRPAPELTWATCVLRVLYNLIIKISLKCYRSWDSSFSIHDNHWPLIEEGILFRTLRNTLTSCAIVYCDRWHMHETWSFTRCEQSPTTATVSRSLTLPIRECPRFPSVSWGTRCWGLLCSVKTWK